MPEQCLSRPWNLPTFFCDIYKATCRICGLFYVGLTQRKLHDRAREHVTAALERSRSSALGEHYRTQHPVPVDADDKDRQPSISRSRCCLNTAIYCTSISRKQWRFSRWDRLSIAQTNTWEQVFLLDLFAQEFFKKKKKNRSLYTIPFITHSFHQQTHARMYAPHSRTSHGKLPTKLGPVLSLFTVLCTRQTIFLFFSLI